MLDGSNGSAPQIIKSADAPSSINPFEPSLKVFETLLDRALIAPDYDIPLATATPAPCLIK